MIFRRTHMQYYYELLSGPIAPEIQRFISVDEEGLLLPFFGDDSQITELQEDVLQDLVREYKLYFGVSLQAVYFRSSVYFDTNKIRFDCIVVTNSDDFKNPQSLQSYLNTALAYKYSFIRYYNTRIYSEAQLLTNPYYQFVVKVLCLRIYGTPYERRIPSMRINDEIFYSIKVMDSKIANLELQWRTNSNPLAACRHTLKHIIRASFEVIAHRVRGYTRDIDLCSQIFIECCPAQKNSMERIHGYLSEQYFTKEQFLSDVKEHAQLLKLINKSDSYVSGKGTYT